jgi:predicted alpha/beta-hydrolase family hydrolase
MAASRPVFLFAHGAGAPSSSQWMQAWAARLGTLGDVVAFDYPYMRAGRRTPDRLPALIEAHAAALADARTRHPGRPVMLAGKSMGSRVGCHLAVSLQDGPDAPAAVICFGYPLRAGRTGALRDQVLLALRLPTMFLQGSRDFLCPVDDMAAVRGRMTAPNELHLIDGADHSLELRVRDLRAAGRTQEQVDADTLGAVAAFVAKHGGAA